MRRQDNGRLPHLILKLLLGQEQPLFEFLSVAHYRVLSAGAIG